MLIDNSGYSCVTFRRLRHMPLVCRRFREACRDPGAWPELHLWGCSIPPRAELPGGGSWLSHFLRWLAVRAPGLQRLKLYNHWVRTLALLTSLNKSEKHSQTRVQLTARFADTQGLEQVFNSAMLAFNTRTSSVCTPIAEFSDEEGTMMTIIKMMHLRTECTSGQIEDAWRAGAVHSCPHAAGISG